MHLQPAKQREAAKKELVRTPLSLAKSAVAFHLLNADITVDDI